jgi:hypothetical protein
LWRSRDLALVIMISVLSFIYTIFVSQIGNIITGIPSFNYLFTVGHAILISVAMLLYEGRRWRLFAQCILVAILFTPTYQGGTPFDPLARLPIVIDAFFVDIVFNSAYGFFEKRNQLVWWAILCVIFYCLTNPFYFMLNLYLFYPTEILTSFMSVAFFMLPVIFVESAIGGYFGFKIYERVKRIGWVNNAKPIKGIMVEKSKAL